MRTLGLLAILLITLACRYRPLPTFGVSDFNWLKGKWQEVHSGDIENWEFPGDTVGNGLGYIPNEEGEIVPNEVMQLVQRPDGFYFIALVNNQNGGQPVPFKITSWKTTSFVAENPGHDFPQRIIYNLKGNGKLQATIEGTLKGKRKQVKFLFRKL